MHPELNDRDVAVVELPEVRDLLLLHSVDVAAAIGPLDGDVIYSQPGDLGYFVARTAGSEIWSLGAAVKTVSVACSHPEMSDEMRRGVLRAFSEMDQSPAVVVSSENYVKASTTGLSVSVTSLGSVSSLVLEPPEAGDFAYLLGAGYCPAVGGDPGWWDLKHLRDVMSLGPILRSVTPVGSHGAQRDLEAGRDRHGLALANGAITSDLTHPGGPGLQFLVLSSERLDMPLMTSIGSLVD